MVVCPVDVSRGLTERRESEGNAGRNMRTDRFVYFGTIITYPGTDGMNCDFEVRLRVGKYLLGQVD